MGAVNNGFNTLLQMEFRCLRSQFAQVALLLQSSASCLARTQPYHHPSIDGPDYCNRHTFSLLRFVSHGVPDHVTHHVSHFTELACILSIFTVLVAYQVSLCPQSALGSPILANRCRFKTGPL